MTDTELTIAIAKVDRFENIDLYIGRAVAFIGNPSLKGTKDGLGESEDCCGRQLINIPPYLTSYDAIIPVIQRQTEEIQGKIVEQFDSLKDMSQLGFRQYCQAFRILQSTPRQLSIALLKALNLYED